MIYTGKFRILAVIILTVFAVNFSYSTNSITGTVRYSDDNSIVPGGMVRLYDLLGVLRLTVPINPDGTYLASGLDGTEYDLIGIPNNEMEEDFVATGYPSAIQPSQMLSVLSFGVVINKDIYVIRLTSGGLNAAKFSISGKVNSGENAVSGAIVYATINDKIYGFSETDMSGNYKINALPAGDYILVVHRIGNTSESANVILGAASLKNINFNIKPLKDFSSVPKVPVTFKLMQNYPNPFNPSTLISYSVTSDTRVKISIYNSLGEEVAVLINNEQKAGAYSVTFDGTNLSSGIYFCKLIAGGFVDTKRMILVK